jgi:hypothetical protein
VSIVFLLARDLTLLMLAAAWAASAGWVAVDARRRLRGRRQAHAALAASLLVPVAAPLLWLCLRPADCALERRERRARRRLLELAAAEEPRCLVCRTRIDAEFACCPGCGLALTRPCRSCGGRLRATWQACPWCAAEPHDDERARAA